MVEYSKPTKMCPECQTSMDHLKGPSTWVCSGCGYSERIHLLGRFHGIDKREDFDPIYTIGKEEPVIYLNKTTGKIIELPFFETSLGNSKTGIKENQQ